MSICKHICTPSHTELIIASPLIPRQGLGRYQRQLTSLRYTPVETHRIMQPDLSDSMTERTPPEVGVWCASFPINSSMAALLPAPNEDGDDLPSARRHY